MAPRKKITTPVRTRRAQGDGSIKQRPNGLWVGTFTYGEDPITGKPKRHQVTGMDKKAFDKKFADAIAAAKNDRPIEGASSMTIATWMHLWHNSVSNKVRPSTKRTRKPNVDHIVARLGSVPIGDLSRKHVEQFHDYLMAPKPRGAGLSARTAKNVHGVFQTAIEDAIGYYNGKVINYNAVKHTDAPEVPEDPIEILEPEEAVRVLDHVWDQRNGSRWAMSILTGARQGEVLGLTWDRVDFENDRITIDRALLRLVYTHGCSDKDDAPTCGHERTFDCPKRFIVGRKHTYQPIELEPGLFLAPVKTKSSVRVIPLVDPLRTFLLAHRDRQAASGEPNPHNLVWTRETRQVGGGTSPAAKTPIYRGQPLDPARDGQAWRRMLEAAGVPSIKLHDARHTAITLLYELGIDELTIQDIAGHADDRITRAYRADGRLTKNSYEALSKLGALITPEGRRSIEGVIDAEVIEGEFPQPEQRSIAA
jgi:integrase